MREQGKKAEGSNRREHKVKAELKELKQDVVRVGNELHRQKQQRKSIKKEKRIMKELVAKINGKENTSKNLRIVKEQWLDKKHNIMFQRDQKVFFRTLEAVEKHESEMPKMQRFVEF